jgi:Ribulose-5-phosphate 4-epimerase and related epimerases and aldolases
MLISEMKQTILEMSKLAYKEKLFAGTSGNLSTYDPVAKLMAITPSGVDYTEMKIDDILVVNLDGGIVEGTRKPSSEWRMHATVYKNRPDITAVIHTHSPHATSFAVVNQEIPIALIEMVRFIGGNIPVAEFAMAGTEELGLSALKVLSNRKCCLLANHGVLTIGENISEAYLSAVYTEDAAKICTFAKMIGEIKLIPIEVQNVMRRKYGMHEE